MVEDMHLRCTSSTKGSSLLACYRPDRISVRRSLDKHPAIGGYSLHPSRRAGVLLNLFIRPVGGYPLLLPIIGPVKIYDHSGCGAISVSPVDILIAGRPQVGSCTSRKCSMYPNKVIHPVFVEPGFIIAIKYAGIAFMCHNVSISRIFIANNVRVVV